MENSEGVPGPSKEAQEAKLEVLKEDLKNLDRDPHTDPEALTNLINEIRDLEEEIARMSQG
jgi:hypothetical protein